MMPESLYDFYKKPQQQAATKPSLYDFYKGGAPASVSPPAEPDWQAEQAAEEAAAQQIASQPWQITAPTLEPMADTSRNALPQPFYNPDPSPITEESAAQERRYAQFPLLTGDQRTRLAQSASGLDPAGRPYNPTGEVVPLPGEPGRTGYIAQQSVAEALSPIADMAAGVPVRLASKLSGAVGGPTTDVADYPIAGALAQPVTPAEAGIRGASSIAGEVGSFVLPVGLPAASGKLASLVGRTGELTWLGRRLPTVAATQTGNTLAHMLGFMAPVTASHANSPLEAAQGVARSPIDLVTSTVAAVPQTVENAVNVASNPTVENVQALTEAARPLAALPLFLRGNKRADIDRLSRQSRIVDGNRLEQQGPTNANTEGGQRTQPILGGVEEKLAQPISRRYGPEFKQDQGVPGGGPGLVREALPPDLLRAITGREPGTGGPVAPELQPTRPPAPADVNPAAKPGGNVILPEPGQDVSGIPISSDKLGSSVRPSSLQAEPSAGVIDQTRRTNPPPTSPGGPAPSAPPPLDAAQGPPPQTMKPAIRKPVDLPTGEAPEFQDPANMVSVTGRKLSPFPDRKITSDRAANKAIRESDEWIINEAIAEAKSRGDNFNETVFKGELPIQKAGLPQASRDAAHLYVFGRDDVKLKRSETPTPPPPQAPEVAKVGRSAPLSSPESVKQPWEMTRAEFRKELIREKRDTRARYESLGGGIAARQGGITKARKGDVASRAAAEAMTAEQRLAEFDRAELRKFKQDEHRTAVKDALWNGKTVPPEVLADYPDLKPTAPPAVDQAQSPVETPHGQEAPKTQVLSTGESALQPAPAAGNVAPASPETAMKKPRRLSRAGIGASEKAILDIHNKYRDVITGSAPEDVGRVEGEATAATGYTFTDTPLNRSLVKEIRDRLPFNLHKQIRLVPRESAEGKYANGADIHAEIGTDAMANAVKSYADRGRKRTIDRTVDFILSNPDKVTAEELYAAKIHKDIVYSPETAQSAKGKKPEVISTNNLGVGDKMEIGGESFTVKNIDGDVGTIDIKDGINYTLPLGADVAIDKGSLKATERKATFDPAEFEDTAPTGSQPGRDLFGAPIFDANTGRQNTLMFGGEDVTVPKSVAERPTAADAAEAKIRRQYNETATPTFAKEPPDSGITLTSGPDIQRGLKLARHAVRGITDAWTRATGLASGATVATELKAISGRQPGANQVHQILRNRSDVAAELHGQNLPQIEEIVRPLTKAERENAMLAFGGREAPVNEKVAAAVEALRRHDEATSEIAATSGLLNAEGEPWKPLKSDWINQEWNDKAVEAVRRERGPLWDKAIQSVAETLKQRGMFVSERGVADKLPPGQSNAESYAVQAVRFLRKNRSRILQDVRPLDRETKEYGTPSTSGSQLHRLVNWPREFLKPDLVESYIEHKRGLLTKSAEAMTVGPGGEKLAEAAARTLDEVEAFARKRGVDIPAAKNYATQIMKEWFGRELGTREKVPGEELLRKAQLTSSIMHLSAGSAFPAANLIFGMASNAFRHGLGRTLVASAKSVPAFLRTGEMYREAVRSGALDWAGVQGVIAEMHIPTLAKELLSGFAGATEAFNRTVAAEAGKSTVESVVQALARKWGKRGEVPAKELIGTRQFRELIDRGFTQKEIFSMAARGEMTPEQVRKAMRGSVEVSQYLARPQDLPRIMTGPRSRAFFQFWSMAYKQTQNGVGKVLSEAGYGNLIPLARFLPLAIAAGYSVQRVRNLLYGERPSDKDKTMLAKMLGYLSDQTGVLDRAFQPFESGSKFVDTLNNQLTPVFVKDAENILNGVVKSVQEISAGEFPFKGLRKIASTSSAYKTAESIKTRLTGSPTPLWWKSSKPYDPNAKKEPPKSSFPLAPMRR